MFNWYEKWCKLFCKLTMLPVIEFRFHYIILSVQLLLLDDYCYLRTCRWPTTPEDFAWRDIHVTTRLEFRHKMLTMGSIIISDNLSPQNWTKAGSMLSISAWYCTNLLSFIVCSLGSHDKLLAATITCRSCAVYTWIYGCNDLLWSQDIKWRCCFWNHDI